MKATFAVLAIALCATGAFARDLQQLPTLSTSGSVPAPAPGPSASGCVASYLQNAGNFNLLLAAVQASSESQLFNSLLSDSSERATVFAPTDAGIQQTLASAGINAATILTDPNALTEIIEYHVTPSQLSATDLQNGFSFNTLLEINGTAQSIAVSGNGASATIVGAASSAPIQGSTTVCNFSVYTLGGLLLPASE